MKKILFGVFLAGLIFQGCKKGDEDPFLSLKSRKARLEGDWKLSTGTATYSQPSTLTNTTTTYTNGTFSTTGTVFGFNVSDNGTYTLQIKINKDGTYESSTNDDGDITSEMGRWTFAGGTGDYKNKEQVVMSPTSKTDKNGVTTTYINTGYEYTYDLIGLKSKEMHIKWSSTDNSTTQTLDFVLTQ